MDFKDHFSNHAALYSRYRPAYPAGLFAFLSKQAPGGKLAWDCATGSGQAAVALAEHFAEVIATDASAKQLESAVPHPKVEYRLARAEESRVADAGIDLITVAQALHWFDHEAFYREVQRVLKPGGLIAVWSYNLLHCESDIDALLYHYYRDIIGHYWAPERRHVENGYQDIPFPFEPLPSPCFAMASEWNMEELLGYLFTWSATQRYIHERGNDPLELIREELAALWGEPGRKRHIEWPLTLHLGRNE